MVSPLRYSLNSHAYIIVINHQKQDEAPLHIVITETGLPIATNEGICHNKCLIICMTLVYTS